jgi:GTPase SAR1 family protein
MCNATPNQKNVLNSINSYSLSDLHNFLNLHNFEINCFIQYGLNAEKLNSIDLEVMKQRVQQEGITREKLLEAGLTKFRVDEIFGVVKETIECPTCNKVFNDLNTFEVFKKSCETCGANTPPPPPPPPTNSLLNRIIERKANVSEIQEALLNNEISVDQLKNECFLTDELIQRIDSYVRKQMSPIEIENLPPLKPDRTDFYFLGMPSAGKSCLIASLLSHWMRMGIASPEIKSNRSVEYFNMLGGQFSKGILPMNNPNAFVDYIELTLNIVEETKTILGRKKKIKYSIPINILDMAGEKFRSVAVGGKEAFDKHKKYLSNKNSKALFFILDYSIDDNGNSTWEQSSNLVVVLKNLADMGILEYTDSIYLIVTKSDMFSVGIADYQIEADKYIQEYYKSFYNELIGLSEDHGFSYEILPYSIGECIFKQLLVDYSSKTNEHLRIFPEELSQRILKLTGRYKGGYRGIFTN